MHTHTHICDGAPEMQLKSKFIPSRSYSKQYALVTPVPIFTTFVHMRLQCSVRLPFASNTSLAHAFCSEQSFWKYPRRSVAARNNVYTTWCEMASSRSPSLGAP